MVVTWETKAGWLAVVNELGKHQEVSEHWFISHVILDAHTGFQVSSFLRC